MLREVYTPGHDLFADTLIMHGVVRHLVASGVVEGRVERIGERYKIVFERDPRPLADIETVELLLLEIERYVKAGEEPVGRIRKIFDANINISATKSWFAQLSEALVEAKLSAFTVDHRERFKEGRSTSKKLSTVYITLSPMYGKYFIENRVAKENKPFGVCSTCFAYLNLGFLYGVATIVIDAANGKKVVQLAPAPRRHISISDLVLLQRLTEGYLRLKWDMPTLAYPLYWLSTGETLYATEDPVDVLVWATEKRGNFQRVTDAMTLDLSRIMDFIAEVKHKTKRWPKFVECLASENPETLAQLAEVVLFGGDEYAVVRAVAAIEKCVERWSQVDKLAEVLFTWRSR